MSKTQKIKPPNPPQKLEDLTKAELIELISHRFYPPTLREMASVRHKTLSDKADAAMEESIALWSKLDAHRSTAYLQKCTAADKKFERLHGQVRAFFYAYVVSDKE